MDLNYDEVGLKVGLEIHFQLNTGRKLFCRCKPYLVEGEGAPRIVRRLRPTQSELGQIDPAAYFEFKKGLTIEYVSPPESTCLVELDEEPPHEMDIESLKAALRIARFIGADIVDEVHVMRKIVVDGSNTTGFQRTSIISMGGSVYVPSVGREIGIQSICLEEEAARIVDRRGNYVIYNLDRLGIPLIEVSTEPDIRSPEEAVEVARYIGQLVTMTGVRRRGLGSIRQDINISISGGPVIEVKGVQRLQQLRSVIEFEVKRQIGLMRVASELAERGVEESIIKSQTYRDVSDIFSRTKNRVISRGLSEGLRVYSVILPRFSGLLGFEVAPGHRLGKEIAERIRFWTGLGGIFHTDEMPKYGITLDEIRKLRRVMDASEDDAMVFFVSDVDTVDLAVARILERAVEALYGPPKETRGAREDGSTFYMRPRPGMARMYPETDIPPILIDDNIVEYLKENPLIPPYKVLDELVNKYGLSRDMAMKLIDMDLYDYFIKLVEEIHSLAPSYISSFLTDRLPYIMNELGLDEYSNIMGLVIEGMKLVDDGVVFKEGLQDIIITAYKEGLRVREAVNKLGLSTKVDYSEIEEYIKNQLETRMDLKKLPKNILVKRLMAIVMSKYRGNVDPKRVIELINDLLR